MILFLAGNENGNKWINDWWRKEMNIFLAESGGLCSWMYNHMKLSGGGEKPLKKSNEGNKNMNIYLASNDNWSKYIYQSSNNGDTDKMKLYVAGGGGVLNRTLEGYKKNMDMYLVTSGGGTGNPQICKDKLDMDLYLAGAESRAKQMKEKSGIEDNLFTGTNILQSFYYCNDFTEKVVIPSCKNFMLDSGAFTFFSSGKHVDWNEYIKKYADFIVRNDIKLFFELDIDVLIGYENVLLLRKKLESLTNKKCIPVWHKSRGMNEFIKMCKEYDYVAIGGIVSKEITQKEYKYFPKLIKIAHDNGAKIHGLGFTNLVGLTKYHFDSVDSTAWVSGNRFGSIYKFNGKTMVKYDKKEGQRLSDSRKVAVHNFKEWVKFSNYAEKNL